MLIYEERFYKEFSDLVKTMKGIKEDLDILVKEKQQPQIQPIIQHPTFNDKLITNGCEGCHIYERLMRGEIVVDDTCYWCSKNPVKITCVCGSGLGYQQPKE